MKTLNNSEIHQNETETGHLRDDGYSVIELVAVIAVLSSIASIAIPQASKIMTNAKVDEAKTLVNSAAAQCLQDFRIDPSKTNISVDPIILSKEKLDTLGYEIKDNTNCSKVELTPKDSNDSQRFNFGFGMTAKGRISKFATPNSTDKAMLSSCRSWAGSQCSEENSLLELIAYEKKIIDAKLACETKYSKWMKSNGNGSYNRWNTAADSDCPSRPPKVSSPTCTPNGCNSTIFALDGNIVGYEQKDYDVALKAKYKGVCADKIESLRRQTPPFTNSGNLPVSFEECEDREFWFVNGTEVKNKTAFTEAICEEAKTAHKKNETTGATTISECNNKTIFYCRGNDSQTENLMIQCIDDDAIATCQRDIKEKIESDYSGSFVAKRGGPGVCSTKQWMCSGESYPVESEFEKNCKPACPLPKNGNGDELTWCDEQRYWNHSTCRTYSTCMKRI